MTPKRTSRPKTKERVVVNPLLLRLPPALPAAPEPVDAGGGEGGQDVQMEVPEVAPGGDDVHDEVQAESVAVVRCAEGVHRLASGQWGKADHGDRPPSIDDASA